MNEAIPPIGEDDLHAYVDAQLDAERRFAVERYLANNVDAAQRVAAYQAQRNAIRAAFKVDADEPASPYLMPAYLVAQRSRHTRRHWLVAASILLALGVGLGGGWLLHTPPELGRAELAMVRLEQEALSSHVVYAVDVRHPIEVPGAEEPHLRQWLSNRLNRTVVAPDLTALGYHLIGGRLLATEGGKAAALLMYDDDQHHRISLILRPMAPALHMPGVTIGQNGVNGRAWIASGLGVAVVATLPEDDIIPLARQISEELGESS